MELSANRIKDVSQQTAGEIQGNSVAVRIDDRLQPIANLTLLNCPEAKPILHQDS
jgi:hypothetical protein